MLETKEVVIITENISQLNKIKEIDGMIFTNEMICTKIDKDLWKCVLKTVERTKILEKKPLGVKPNFIFKEDILELKRKRIHEIKQAIGRFAEKGLEYPTIWLEEIRDLERELK